MFGFNLRLQVAMWWMKSEALLGFHVLSVKRGGCSSGTFSQGLRVSFEVPGQGHIGWGNAVG